jgi:hypothetical protein
LKKLFPVVVIVAMTGCGGGSGSSTPTTPTTTTTANRNPAITAMNFAPTFGIAGLTLFDYNASGSDPDGDALTFTWDVAGSASTGASGSIRFAPPGGSGTARVTVTDGKGGTVTDTREFVVGSGSGTWRGNWGAWVFTSNLTQNNTILTGDYSDQLGPGRLDSAVANTIDASGNVRLRYKQAIFSDFIFTGTMDTTGRRITGVVNGSGASNVPFSMTK